VDPEEIYQEVLSEEQAKGSASAVAEGRAKAARQRAIHGSPHPKEPRWWPGSQPQFEEGAAVEAASEPEPQAEAAPEPEPQTEPEPAPAPAEEAPAAAAPAAPDIGDEAQSQRAETPAPAPAEAQPAAAAVATAPAAAAPQRPAGVTHGTESGNRLRPEDAVGTDAQFDAQKAMAERRRLIDELVATGVPAATAAESGRPKAPLLLLAYVLIPLLAIALLAASDEDGAGATPPDVSQTQPGEDGGGGGTNAVVAEGLAFDVETITLAAGEPATIDFDNRDAGAQHNIAIYEGEDASGEIFVGELITGPDTITYEFDAPKAGEYFFRCDVHPDMSGTVVSE
jgi:plastocyanin